MKTPDTNDNLLTVGEAAKVLRISERTLRRYCEERRIGFHDLPCGRRFSQAHVNQFLRISERPAVAAAQLMQA